MRGSSRTTWRRSSRSAARTRPGGCSPVRGPGRRARPAVGAGRHGQVPGAPARRRGRARRGAGDRRRGAGRSRPGAAPLRARADAAGGRFGAPSPASPPHGPRRARGGAGRVHPPRRGRLGRQGGCRAGPHRWTHRIAVGAADAERRIAEQVAAGLSNKEIAAALFLSVSTVEAALWKVYRKLDVRSRTQLAARLAERRS